MRLMGKSLVESIEIGRRMAQETNRIFIHPYDDEEVIAGQGTVGLEILEDLPDADLIIVPVGGGGLIAGIALAAKAIRPEARVVGVQPASCPSARKALELGRPAEVDAEEQGSIADAIMVTRVGEAPFPLLQKLVDDIVLVDEDQIASAVLKLLERKRILAEGAAAPVKRFPSMAQDVFAGRQTEVDFLNGAIADAGEAAGVPVPVNRTMWQLMKGLEHSWSDPA